MTVRMKSRAAAWDRWLNDLADSRRAFRITVFGRSHFSTGWDMGQRVLDEHMLHFLAAGGQVGEVGGRPVRTAAGSLLWVPAGIRQTLRQIPAGLTMHYLRFTVAGAVPPAGEPPVRDHLPGAGALMGELYAEHLGARPGREIRMRALLVQLFVEWWRAGSVATGLEPAQQQRLLAAVDADPARRWQPAGLARLLGLSPTWFARRFRRSLGCSPRRWLMERRIHRAAALLVESDRPIGDIAHDLGYADLFLLSRQFSAVMGMPPRAWRARHRAS